MLELERNLKLPAVQPTMKDHKIVVGYGKVYYSKAQAKVLQ